MYIEYKLPHRKNSNNSQSVKPINERLRPSQSVKPINERLRPSQSV